MEMIKRQKPVTLKRVKPAPMVRQTPAALKRKSAMADELAALEHAFNEICAGTGYGELTVGIENKKVVSMSMTIKPPHAPKTQTYIFDKGRLMPA